MSWQPCQSWNTARKRANTLSSIRRFFDDRGIVEVDTALLSHGTITDLHLEPFISQFNYSKDSHCDTSIDLYLQTSPEFAMKRLLASGYGCCYQICKAFRHEEHGRFHNPEFSMLEWYRLGFDHFELMAEVGELLQLVLGCKLVEKISYQALFKRELALDPLSASKEDFLEVIASHKMMSDWLVDESNADTLMQFIMSEILEPRIGQSVPCFIYNFPASQASLAKISTKDSRVSERFECYFKGIELANGFHELTNAQEQLARFEAENSQRLAVGKMPRPIDKRFIDSLTSGLPACAGVAVGIDRLMMLALDAKHIDQVLTFPIERA